MLGFFAWIFSFQSELNDPNYFLNNKIQESEFSSQAPINQSAPDEVDVALLAELQLSEVEWNQKSDEPYSTSPAEVEQYEKLSQAAKNESAYYMQVESAAPLVDYENEKNCGTSRLAVDRVLKKNNVISELIKERESEEHIFPRKCLIHVMNQFDVPSTSIARCPNGIASAPIRGGVKPCVSKALVNLTYNSFIDVTSCLEINPKSLIPKLANESGMLINTLGSGLDAGIGQLTGVAIEETNKYYDKFMLEIESNAASNPACARILKYKSLLKKVSAEPSLRCGLIAPPENPLKNILYMAMLNRINTNTIRKKFENNDIQSKLNKLGLEQPNVNALIEAIALASYNAGPTTAFNALNEYLDKRIKANKNLSIEDFDFNTTKTAVDIDGAEKSVTRIARSFVNSPFIKIKDPDLKIKLKKAKLLPEKIRAAHMLTFPEFLIYNQNNFDQTQKTITKSYKTIGAPGYLGFLADKNKALRDAFIETSEGPDYCSDPEFLKTK